MSKRRVVVIVVATMLALPAIAQVSVEPSRVRSGNKVVDGTGVHTAAADVDADGVGLHGSKLGGTLIRTDGGTRPIDCGGQALTVAGNGNHFRVSHCAILVVNGNLNEIDVAFSQAGRLSIRGNRNTVIWRAAPRVGVAVNDLGSRNAVVRR